MIPRFFISLISWKSVSILASAAFILQVVSLLLLWYSSLLTTSHKKSSLLFEEGLTHQESKFQLSKTHSKILVRIAQWSLLDTSGEYKFATGILRGSTTFPLEKKRSNDNEAFLDKSDEYPWNAGVTLVTQCSFGHVYLLPKLAEQWKGPVSVAVFLLSNEVETGVHTFLQLHRCFPSVKENVTFSIVFPLNSPTTPRFLKPTASLTPCEKLLDELSSNSAQANYYSHIPYPNNLLRNTAKKAVSTPFMMLIDIDMMPSVGLHTSFMVYAHQHGLLKSGRFSSSQDVDDKTVWVVPSYELKEDFTHFPQTKNELLQLKEKGVVRPFYQELCWKCQRYTDYNAWEEYKDTTGSKISSEAVKPIYEVFWRDPWEPFYISRVTAPSYDERFRQYGFNRISQVCELHVSGHRFLVLDSAFLVHKGFKVHRGFHPSKDLDLQKNQVLFRQFKNDLKEKYPESSRRCY